MLVGGVGVSVKTAVFVAVGVSVGCSWVAVSVGGLVGVGSTVPPTQTKNKSCPCLSRLNRAQPSSTNLAIAGTAVSGCGVAVCGNGSLARNVAHTMPRKERIKNKDGAISRFVIIKPCEQSTHKRNFCEPHRLWWQ